LSPVKYYLSYWIGELTGPMASLLKPKSIAIIGVSRDDVVELDINPVIAYENGAVAVDARVLERM
jgi:acyl-CoA synthetase (NDP forming)